MIDKQLYKKLNRPIYSTDENGIVYIKELNYEKLIKSTIHTDKQWQPLLQEVMWGEYQKMLASATEYQIPSIIQRVKRQFFRAKNRELGFNTRGEIPKFYGKTAYIQNNYDEDGFNTIENIALEGTTETYIEKGSKCKHVNRKRLKRANSMYLCSQCNKLWKEFYND